MSQDKLTEQIIGCAIEVHRVLGPGLLESVYEECLCQELRTAGVKFERQCSVPVDYKGTRLETGYRVDIIVGAQVVLEIKSVDKLIPVHQAQMLSYLKLGNYSKGLLINFNTRLLKDGIKRFVL